MCHFESVKILGCYVSYLDVLLEADAVTTVTHSIMVTRPADLPGTEIKDVWLRSRRARLLSHGTGRIFDPVEKFDRTFCSHGTVQDFCSVHTERTEPG